MRKLVLLVMVITLITLIKVSPKVVMGVDSQSLPIRGVVHIQRYADEPLTEGQWAGTRGLSLRLEGFAFNFSPPRTDLGFEYMCHIQGIGDTQWMAGGEFCGTRGESRRVEGIAVRLTGASAGKYDVYYTCHLEIYGDQADYANGGFCGTRGRSLRLEAMVVWVLPKGSQPPIPPQPILPTPEPTITSTPRPQPSRTPRSQPSVKTNSVYFLKQVPYSGNIYYLGSLQNSSATILTIKNPDLGLGQQWIVQILKPNHTSDECGSPDAVVALQPGQQTDAFNGWRGDSFFGFCIGTLDQLTYNQGLPSEWPLDITYR